MTLYYRTHENQIAISGRTYPHKETIKSLGGRFVREGRLWFIPMSDNVLDQVKTLCQQAGGGALSEPEASPVEIKEDSAPAADGLSVSQLVAQVADVVQRHFSQAVWVLGEVQNIRRSKYGLYFSLAEPEDENSQKSVSINAVIWTGTLKVLEEKHGKDKIKEIFADGLKIRCLCQVNFYHGRASLSLQVTAVDPSYTQGALALAREKLLKELRAKGLDKANKRHSIGTFPLRVGLISAENSRAESDFCHQLFAAGFPGKVFFVPAAMQGDLCPKEVCAGIATLSSRDVDVIVITRGGGSAADLRWFDSPQVAYQIAQAPVPIVAAIGHHDDFCVAEEICFVRMKTPTAAADYIAGIFATTGERLTRLQEDLGRLLTAAVDASTQRVSTLAHYIDQAATRLLTAWEHRLETLGRGLCTEAERFIAHEQQKILEWQAKLAQKDPSPWLAKGWTQVFGESGAQLTSVAELSLGQKVHIRLKDGHADLEVTHKELRDQNP